MTYQTNPTLNELRLAVWGAYFDVQLAAQQVSGAVVPDAESALNAFEAGVRADERSKSFDRRLLRAAEDGLDAARRLAECEEALAVAERAALDARAVCDVVDSEVKRLTAQNVEVRAEGDRLRVRIEALETALHYSWLNPDSSPPICEVCGEHPEEPHWLLGHAADCIVPSIYPRPAGSQ